MGATNIVELFSILALTGAWVPIALEDWRARKGRIMGWTRSGTTLTRRWPGAIAWVTPEGGAFVARVDRAGVFVHESRCATEGAAMAVCEREAAR